jgi:hypothetical protein
VKRRPSGRRRDRASLGMRRRPTYWTDYVEKPLELLIGHTARCGLWFAVWCGAMQTPLIYHPTEENTTFTIAATPMPPTTTVTNSQLTRPSRL